MEFMEWFGGWLPVSLCAKTRDLIKNCTNGWMRTFLLLFFSFYFSPPTKVLQSQSVWWSCCNAFVLHESGGKFIGSRKHESPVRRVRAAATKHGPERGSTKPRGTIVNSASYRRRITNLRRSDRRRQLVFRKSRSAYIIPWLLREHLCIQKCIWQLKYYVSQNCYYIEINTAAY